MSVAACSHFGGTILFGVFLIICNLIVENEIFVIINPILQGLSPDTKTPPPRRVYRARERERAKRETASPQSTDAMSSRFVVSGQRVEDRRSFASDVEERGDKRRRAKRNSTIFDSNAKVFVLGVLLGCVVYVGSSAYSVVGETKNVHQRFRASRAAWRNWEEIWTYRKR